MAKLTSETTVKKPHPFSKEGRALREAQQEPIISNNLPEQVEVKQDSTMQAILARLDRQEEELKTLRGDKDINKDAKEKFKWPRHYRFSLWAWVPVLSWETKRRDNTKDLVFKNQFWQYESNHDLLLQLLDGTTATVDVTLFNRDRSKCEPMLAKLIVDDKTWATSYVFNTEEYWVVTILSSNFIN